MQLAMAICQAHESAVFPIDLLILSGIKKTLSINKGYLDQLRSNNYTCAAALLRIQVDSALRLFASTIAKDTNKLVSDFIEGKPINKLRDFRGKLLTDTYLHTELSKQFPWVTSVYEQSSGFVHLSEKHFFATFKNMSKDRTANLVLSDEDDHVTDVSKNKTTIAMLAVNKLIFEICENWLSLKSNHLRNTPGIDQDYISK
jgi:hypothetical protein